MNLADLSIRRPVFITSILTLILVAGYLCLRRLPVDLFPNVTFPVVVVSVPYPGAGPAEIETLVAKPLEDELSTISGLKRLTSLNQEGVGTVYGEFSLETDIKYAEDKVREAVTRAKVRLPKDSLEPIIKRIDPADQPILILAVTADLPEKDLFDLADEIIKPKLEQVNKVGLVEILGGRKREIEVALDRKKLKSYEVSASQVAARIQASGENIPLGKSKTATQELVFRSLGQFQTLADIKSVIVNFFGNDVAVTVGDVSEVKDGLREEKSRTFLNGEKSLFVYVFRQSGSNTVAVANAIKKRIDQINADFVKSNKKAQITVVRDGARWIQNNILDVTETILLGIILAVFVVYLFLASGRSTFITALALPNSLIGAFILMAAAGFSINLMSLLALSLAVGLLIDDAIVVRENIFRHLEMGKKPVQAALDGTGEVRLAVIATTFTVIAVFGPVGFLNGIVGQFFKEFGLTVCFAMLISLLDAMTVAPMLSAYLATTGSHEAKLGFFHRTVLEPFNRFYFWAEEKYILLLKVVLKHPLKSLGISFLIFLASIASASFVTKTFMPAQDAGEFLVAVDLPPGTSLNKTAEIALEVDKLIRTNPEVAVVAFTIGDRDGDSTVAEGYVHLVPFHDRSKSTGQVKDLLREQLKPYAQYNPKVKDFDAVGGGQRPFILNISGPDIKVLEEYGLKLHEKLEKYPGLLDVDISFRPGKPEFQVQFDKVKQERMGISSLMAGQEMRIQIDGATPAKFRENDREYDIRVRLAEDQRNLKENFDSTYIPNINGRLVPLSLISKGVEAVGPSKITRLDRNRYVGITADISPKIGLGQALTDITKMLEEDPDTKLPVGLSFSFVGQAENFKEMGENMAMAMGLGTLLIYFVLASLYESFIIPFTIMLALPLALCGSFFALFITRESLNIFSWIGVIMLLGVSTKNSILMVDYAHQLVNAGSSRYDALIKAGKTRLRPILMTTFALIAGTLPLAIGLNEASKMRTSMGIAIIGGLISSTLLTLVVVPAAYTYVDRFRLWFAGTLKRLVNPDSQNIE